MSVNVVKRNKKTKKHKPTNKIPFFIIRILFDLTAVLIGVIAGKINPDGIQGSAIGSIIMSLMLGPVISLVGRPLKKILDPPRTEQPLEEPQSC